MIERRRTARRKPTETLTIFDINARRRLGQVANLTNEGFLLVGQEAIPQGAIYQLEILLQFPVNGLDRLSFGAQSVWTSQAGDAGEYYWTGFNIIDIADETAEFIAHWTSQWQIDRR